MAKQDCFDSQINFTEHRLMIARIITVTVAASFVAALAFGQMKYSRGRAPSPTPAATQSPTPAQRTSPPTQSRSTATPAPTQAKPTPTPVPPPDVKAYLDRQLTNSHAKKF